MGLPVAVTDIDGNVTSGPGAALAKRNRQLPETGAAATEARRLIQKALAASGQFLSAALPRTVYPPLFNRYGIGEGFGEHVDNAIRVDHAGGQMRTDLSATVFLGDPDVYEGGALEIETSCGRISSKLGAGQMLLYPATSLHRVTPITSGEPSWPRRTPVEKVHATCILPTLLVLICLSLL